MIGADEPRRTLAETREELERTRGENRELRATVGMLPDAKQLAQRYRGALAEQRRAWLRALLAGLGLGATYWAVLAISSMRDPEPIVIRMGPTDPVVLREELDRLRPALARAREEVDEARFGSLPPLPPAQPGTTPYQGLQKLGIVDGALTDDALRWANIGVAACTVRQPDLARWALGVLRSTAPEDPLQRLPEPLGKAIAAVHLQCSTRGHSLLRSPEPSEP